MQKYRPAPLRLLDLFFPRISIEALSPSGDANSIPRLLDPNAMQINFQYIWNEGEDGVAAGMRLKVPPPSDGEEKQALLYAVDMEAIAFFELVGAEYQDARAQYLRRVAAASTVLGAIREQISMTTARGPWGTLTVPLVGMDAIVGTPPDVMPAESKPGRRRKATRPE